MTRHIPRDLIAEALDNASFDEDCIRDKYGYIGGHTCPGVVLPNQRDYTRFMVELARLSDVNDDGTHNRTIDWMIDAVRWDNMGRTGLIFFWPYLEFTG